MAGWHTRLWRRVKLAPGVTVNLSKSGPSLSLGPRGSKVTFGRRGVRQTVGIPGTGFYATRQLGAQHARPASPEAPGDPGPGAAPVEPGPVAGVATDTSADTAVAFGATPAPDDEVVIYYGMATLLGIVVGLGALVFRVPQGQALTAGFLTAVAGIVYEGLAHHHPGPAKAVVAVIVGLISFAATVAAVIAVAAVGAALAGGHSRRRRRW